MKSIKIKEKHGIELRSTEKYDFQKQIKKNLEKDLGEHVWIE